MLSGGWGQLNTSDVCGAGGGRTFDLHFNLKLESSGRLFTTQSVPEATATFQLDTKDEQENIPRQILFKDLISLFSASCF